MANRFSEILTASVAGMRRLTNLFSYELMEIGS
jgi:hypothetical protein